MKHLDNVQTGIKINMGEEGVQDSTYADLISMAIRQQKPGGFDYHDIEMRSALSATVKNLQPGGVMNIEDAPAKYLVELVANAKWPFWHEDLLTFKEEVIKLGDANKRSNQSASQQ